MGNDVFANGREVSCKAADGKSIAAFPDVCMTPPENPATPPGVPVPYPNTGMATDTTDGTTTVKISGKEAMLKNKSYFKQSTGDEAGCAAKKGVITSVNRGKVYFTAWSMDVKFEGENVVRHLDMTTHNHASAISNESVPWPYVDTNAITPDHPCYKSVCEEQEACNPHATPPGSKPRMRKNNKGELVQKGNYCTKRCSKARSCALPKKRDDKKACCYPNTTGDHIVEVNCFTESGGRSPNRHYTHADINSIGNVTVTYAEGMSKSTPRRLPPFESYNDEEAPTACVRPPYPGTNHDRMQRLRDVRKREIRQAGLDLGLDPQEWGLGREEESWWTYDQAAEVGVKSHQSEFSHCNPDCTRAQLDQYHHSILPGDSEKDKNQARLRTYIPDED